MPSLLLASLVLRFSLSVAAPRHRGSQHDMRTTQPKKISVRSELQRLRKEVLMLSTQTFLRLIMTIDAHDSMTDDKKNNADDQ